MREWLLDPLQMRQTTWDHQAAAASRAPVALGHTVDQAGNLRPAPQGRSEPPYRPAGTDVVSSVADLAKFAIAHVNAGHFANQQFLPAQAVAAMHTWQVETHDIRDEGHGLTFVLDTYKGVRRVGHGGLSGHFAGFFRLAPERAAGAVILYNRWQDFLPATQVIMDALFDHLLDLPTAAPSPPPATEDRTRWPQYTGRYAGWWTGLAAVHAMPDGLAVESKGQTVHLEPVREHVYRGAAYALSIGFVPEPDGSCQWMKLNGLLCQRLLDEQPDQPRSLGLETYAGTYRGALDTLTVRVNDGGLAVHSAANAEEVDCVPVDDTRFSCAWGLVEFHLKPDGAVACLKAGQRPLQEPLTYWRM